MEENMQNCTHSESWKSAKERSLRTLKNKAEFRIIEYLKNPSRCINCEEILEYSKRHNKFCTQSCSASHNNKGVRRNNSTRIGGVSYCEYCGKTLTDNRCKYCSPSCSDNGRKRATIQNWKKNYIEIKVLTPAIRNYLIENANNKCCICGWGEINQYSGNYALIVDHIDGNSENNSPCNLRVLCPNCDSLLPTYKGLNKGSGRAFRRQRYAEGKSS